MFDYKKILMDNEKIFEDSEKEREQLNKQFNELDETYTNIMNGIKIHEYMKKNKLENPVSYKVVTYNNNKYIVCKIMRNKYEKLFVVDYDDRHNVINQKWYMTSANYIGKFIRINGDKHTLLLHNYVMGKYTFNGIGQDSIYDHINRIPFDNRKANLRFFSTSNNMSNVPRKKRKVTLPINCKIDCNELPVCVWYRKALPQGKGHRSDSFCVEINDENKNIRWFSTAMSQLSLRFKLEQTKKYLRLLKATKPEIFKNHNIEYEYSAEGLKLAKEYNEIIKLSKYNCVNANLIKINEKNYLEENLTGLTEQEIELLNNFTLDKKNQGNKKFISKLPKDCGITSDMIPKYCYYSPSNEKNRRGTSFVIDKHPKLKTKEWRTTSKKDVNIQDKFQMLLDKIKELEQL